jgi:putative hydrolase of the HAD superfamily
MNLANTLAIALMLPMHSVDALIFDLGGVVVEIDFRRVFAAWSSHTGVTPETIASRFRFDAAYAAHEKGEIEAPEFFDALRGSLGLEISDEQFLAGWNEIFVQEMPNMRGLLRQTEALFPLYLFSNTNTAHKQYFLNNYQEVLSPFRELFLSSDIGMRKPEPEAFHAIAARIGMRPERLAFFDDLPENVAGARAAGLKAFHVRSADEIAAALRNELGIVWPR